MKRFLAVALLLSAFPAPAQTVETAEGNWRALPPAKERGTSTISPLAIVRIHEVIANGDCVVPGQSKRKLNITVSFALHFSPDGALQRIVLPKLGCAEIEGILGGAVLELTKNGRFAPSGENDAGWYRSEISFTSSDQFASAR